MKEGGGMAFLSGNKLLSREGEGGEGGEDGRETTSDDGEALECSAEEVEDVCCFSAEEGEGGGRGERRGRERG